MESIIVILIFNFILLFGLLVHSIIRSPLSIFSPIALSAIGLIIMYVLRPLYIIQNNQWGASPFDLRSLDGNTLLFKQSLIVTFLFILIFSFSLFIYLRFSKFRKKDILFSLTISRIINRFFLYFISISFLFLLLPFMLGYSLNQYLALLATRGIMLKTFYGQFGGFLDIFVFMSSSLALLKIGQNIILGKPYLLISLLVIILLMFLGGRSNILFFILSIGAIKVFIQGKFKQIYFFYLFLFVIIFGVGYRVLTRDIYFLGNRDRVVSEVLYDSFINSHEFLVGGFDFVQIDALMTVIDDSRLESGFLYGSTILSCLTSPIPRALWTNKPKGAMSYFTEKYYPNHFENTNGGELIVSWLVENILNFGYFGIFSSSLSMVFFIIFIENGIRNSNNIYQIVFFSVLLPRPFNIIKSDIFNNFINIIKLIIFPLYFIIKFKRKI